VMDFDQLLAAIENLLLGEFKFYPADTDNVYCDVDRRTIKTVNGNVTIYGTARIRFEGNGHYMDNMEFLDDFHVVYDFVVKNMYEHKIKFDAKVLLLREAVETLQELNCINATFVENFDTISPTVSVLSGDVVLFRLIPKFRTIFAQFIDDDDFDEVGNADYNGFDMRVSNIAEKGRKLPSGFHVFRQQPGNEALYGLRAFLTPCTIKARTITVRKVIQNEYTPCAFYDKLLGEETVKVIEYTVP
jgi:hypothetical protein